MPNRIKELREAQGLTLERVAEAAGTTFQQVQRLETGTRRLTVEWMERLARALGVQAADLIADSAPSVHELAQQREDALVLEWWHLLTPDEKRMIAAFARAKGLEILANNPENRRA